MKHLTKIETARWLAGHDDYCIITHRRPDGDTLGSSAALCRVLRGMGKSAHILANPEMTDKYRALHEGLTSGAVAPGATVVSVDLAAETMFPASCADLTDRVELLIDHHGSNSGYAREGLVEENTAACGEIIYDLMLELGAEMTTEIAEAIYTAVSTDTGCFRYSNTTAHSHAVAGRMIAAGCDFKMINRVMFEIKSQSRIAMEKEVLATMEYHFNKKVALVYITRDMMERTGALDSELEEIASMPRQIEGVLVGATLRQRDDGYKISLRSGEEIDSAAICGKLGGGGHRCAAGCFVKGNLEHAKKEILAVVGETLGYGEEKC